MFRNIGIPAELSEELGRKNPLPAVKRWLHPGERFKLSRKKHRPSASSADENVPENQPPPVTQKIRRGRERDKEAPPKATDEKQPVPKRWFYMEGDQWIEAGEFPAMKWPLPPSTKTHLEQVVNGSLCQSANSMSSGETSDPYLPTHYYDEDGRLLWIRPRENFESLDALTKMWAESTAFWNMLDGLRKDLSSQRHSGALRKLACLSRAKTFMSYYFTPFSVPQALHYVSRIADPIVQDGKVQSDPMDRGHKAKHMQKNWNRDTLRLYTERLYISHKRAAMLSVSEGTA
ncbi:hypothetical protein HDK77DRAFT_485899 [Phyllosticta capitalensis]